jgi:hypothetical protein
MLYILREVKAEMHDMSRRKLLLREFVKLGFSFMQCGAYIAGLRTGIKSGIGSWN